MNYILKNFSEYRQKDKEMSTKPEPENNINNAVAETEPEASDHLPTAEAMAEPFPEWSKAAEEWGIAWELHQYGLGVIYGLIFLVTLISLWKRLNGARIVKQNKVPIIVLSLLGVFCLTRNLFLCIDAYHWRKTAPFVVVNVLWGIGQPCLITAYTLVFIVMRNALVLKQRFQKWYNTRNIALATLPYFFFALGAELTISFIPAFKGLAFACQLLYILFGVSLTVFYSIISILIWKKFKLIDSNKRWAAESSKTRETRTRVILRTCLAAVAGGVLICVMQVYAMAGVYGVFSDVRNVPAWPWLAFQTMFRLVEIYMVIVLCYAVNERSVGTKKVEMTPSTMTAESAPANTVELQNV